MSRKNVFYLTLLLLFSSQTMQAQLETCNLVITDGIHNERLKQTIEKNVSEFLSACNVAIIKGKKPDLNKQTTTNDARKRFLAIWENSPLACSISQLERKCLIRPAGGYQIRDIPVTMFDAPQEEQNQEIVINLTADGKIDDVFIPVAQYIDLLNANIEIEDVGLRFIVLEFVERFRTAYTEKKLSYIADMFSDNAIIIVGKEIKKKPNTDSALSDALSTTQIKYQVKSKEEYITALANVFKNNKYVSVKFDSIEVVRHPNPRYPVYGVTLKQDWRSGNNTAADYMDTGYVFLLIDFENPKLPLITVRTWQPEKLSNGNLLPRDEIFQMGNFIK